MIKLFITTALVLFTSYYLEAQNPESGAFWSLSTADETLNEQTNSYEGMGYTDTPSGKYAFVFTNNKVSVYYNGFLGENYERKKDFPITFRKMYEENDVVAKYKYECTRNGITDYSFEIHVSKENYNVAIVYFCEDFQGNIPLKRTCYTVIKNAINSNL
mgnify:CR=1 FL=1